LANIFECVLLNLMYDLEIIYFADQDMQILPQIWRNCNLFFSWISM